MEIAKRILKGRPRETRSSLPQPKESDIQTAILDYLRSCKDLEVWRVPLGGIPHSVGGKTIYRPNPMSGFPDICGIFGDGRMFAFEVKRPGRKADLHQMTWLNRLRQMNCISHVVTCLEDVIDIVTTYRAGGYELKYG